MRLVGIAVMGAGVWLALVAGAAAQTRVTVPIIVKPGASGGTTGGRPGAPSPAQTGNHPQTINVFVRDGSATAGKLSSGASGNDVNIVVRDGHSTAGKLSSGAAPGSRDVNIIVSGNVAVETPIVVVPE
jgi:hypothetical protein